ncbi:MAG: helix-turn-helix domain-containing protein [Clostridiales bacterium]|jgi:transcriptional regulator with XRE-family HTH domain|nr:helix-turn-helix domain-containing protein [Clostridiales bacterium]
MKFSNVLKDLRKNQNLTLSELSEKIGYSRSIICEWEKGKKEPTAGSLSALADFFNISTDYLLGRENEDGTKTYENTQSTQSEKPYILKLYNALPNERQKKRVEWFIEGMLEDNGTNEKK